MNFRAPRNDEFELNVTPLIDVVLVLLIFYMVSTTFVSESKMELTLPQASISRAHDRLRAALDSGLIILNSTTTTLTHAVALLRPAP